MPETTPAPVRVLHTAGSLGLGGTEKVMQALCVHLPRARYAPAVHSPQDGPRGALLREAGVPTHVGCDLFTAIRRVRPAIVHLHRAGWPEPELLRTVRLAGAAVVVETNVFGRHDPSRQAAIIDRTLFVSHFCARRHAEDTGIPAEPPRWSVLYNPVDTDRFAQLSHPAFAAPVVGRLARPDPGKWSPLALSFLPEAARRVPGLRYRMVGAIPEARAFVREHGLEQVVEYVDPMTTDEELAGFLSSLSALAHANDTGESFGLAIAEAMAAGLPVVTHPAGGRRDNAQLELVENGRTGLVARTTHDYAEAVIRLLTDPPLARAMGEAGREKAGREFRAQDIAAKLADIYDELLDSKGIPHP
jgi:glycosyltransferase involved in cell wall biosynthesis